MAELSNVYPVTKFASPMKITAFPSDGLSTSYAANTITFVLTGVRS